MTNKRISACCVIMAVLLALGALGAEPQAAPTLPSLSIVEGKTGPSVRLNMELNGKPVTCEAMRWWDFAVSLKDDKNAWNTVAIEDINKNASKPELADSQASIQGVIKLKEGSTPVLEWRRRIKTLPPDGYVQVMETKNISKEDICVSGSTIQILPFSGKPALGRFGKDNIFGLLYDYHDPISYYDYGDYHVELKGEFATNFPSNAAMYLYSPKHVLKPGGTWSWKLEVGIKPGGMTNKQFDPDILFQDAFKATAAKYPHVLNWPDRRPILMWIPMADYGVPVRGYSSNPRGYFIDDNLDVATPEGFKAFKERLLKAANGWVANCHKANAQGIILWDFEGEECRHAVTYIGSPDRIIIQSPEMDEVADELFAILREGGVRYGMTLRPQELKLMPGRDPDWPPSILEAWLGTKYHQDGEPATACFFKDGDVDRALLTKLMADKIGYAYKRWKATLFYIDSPANLSGEIINDLAKSFPDCLIIPEFPVLPYYSAAAPLHVDGFLDGAERLKRARKIWPEAFGCSFMYHVFGEKEAEEKFVRCLRQGNVYVGIGSQDYMRKLLEANFNPEWHDPSKFKWNDSQPTSRWTTSRLLELRDKERKMDK